MILIYISDVKNELLCKEKKLFLKYKFYSNIQRISIFFVPVIINFLWIKNFKIQLQKFKTNVQNLSWWENQTLQHVFCLLKYQLDYVSLWQCNELETSIELFIVVQNQRHIKILHSSTNTRMDCQYNHKSNHNNFQQPGQGKERFHPI